MDQPGTVDMPVVNEGLKLLVNHIGESHLHQDKTMQEENSRLKRRKCCLVFLILAVVLVGTLMVPVPCVHAVTFAVELMSVATDGIQANENRSPPSLSAGARCVAIDSYATNFSPGGTKGSGHILVAFLDKDGDGVPDAKDTCPADHNPFNENDSLDRQFRDTDGDGIMDACDNCPSVANPDQQDKDGNYIGDPCEACRLTVEASSSGPLTRRTPHWERICVKNSSRDRITIVRPDCYNIQTKWRKASDLSLIVPRDRHGNAYGIPDDLMTLQPGKEACVHCDLSETVAPENLPAGNYLVDHIYTNWVQDRYYNFRTKSCKVDPEPCYPEIWIGWMTAGEPKTITVEEPKEPVPKLEAQCAFSPETWMTEWAAAATTLVITATVSGISFEGLDTGSIRMNGHTRPVSSTVDSSGNLILQFNCRDAVSSLRTPVLAGRFFQTIQGKVRAGYFTAQSPVSLLDALSVAMDIKPGAHLNGVSLWTDNSVPVVGDVPLRVIP